MPAVGWAGVYKGRRSGYLPKVVAVIALLLLVHGSPVVAASNARAHDPPILVPWNRIGDIAFGEPKARVEQEYGAPHGFPRPYYWLHGGKVWVDYDHRGRVADFGFTTPYYRTTNGFGVGSRIPLGPCYRTAANACEHRWHGFIYNPTLRVKPCGCWVKAGAGRTSLDTSAINFGKPWFFIYLRSGRVSGFYFDVRYID